MKEFTDWREEKGKWKSSPGTKTWVSYVLDSLKLRDMEDWGVSVSERNMGMEKGVRETKIMLSFWKGRTGNPGQQGGRSLQGGRVEKGRNP